MLAIIIAKDTITRFLKVDCTIVVIKFTVIIIRAEAKEIPFVLESKGFIIMRKSVINLIIKD